MGYVTLYADCIRCGRPFYCSPTRVPSVRVNGVREPICESCVRWANPLRVAKGLAPIEILPGAYQGDPEGPEEDC